MTDRTHAAPSADGTKIVSDVVGAGPPLVLVHGSLEDGRTCWRAMLPLLQEAFTCYLLSTRNRGRSGAADDLSPQRRLEDVVAVVDSIAEPAFVFGESDGGALALGVAAATDVAAVAAYEPTVFEVADDQLRATLDATVPAVAQALEDDESTEAAELFTRMIASDDELAALSASEYLEEAGQYMPVFLRELQQQEAASGTPSPTSSSRVAGISVPTLLMYGSDTKLQDWFTRGVRHVGEHVRDPHVQEIPGAGHFGVVLQPRPIAEELTRFFAATVAA